MNMIDTRIADLVPAHYREYAPRFITFLEKYYEWLYRTSGLSPQEIEDLKADTSWLQEDIDKFIATGQLRYFDKMAEPKLVDEVVGILNRTVPPGTHANNLRDNFLMEGDFNGYAPLADSQNPGDNDNTVELETIENSILDGWFNSMGFDRIKRSKLKTLSNIDQVLMISLLKHIYAIKGTEASIRLFFNLMFEEDVIIYQPKRRVAVVDESFVLEDIDSKLRDDELFQEYSYVIVVAESVDTYRDVLETIYMSTLHPAGFRVQLIQVPYDQRLALESGGFLLVDDDVYLDIYE